MDNRPIAVFDSGVGSLSVIRLLRKEIPGESIVYLADRARYPYGKKTKEQLKSIIIQTLKYLERFGPKIIIVASITPSIQVLRECKVYTNIPVFGVYLNIEEAVSLSKSKFIALLATEGITQSTALDDYVKPFIMTTRIINVNASPIIDVVESGKFLEDYGLVKETISNNTAAISSNPKIDVIILGSTHLSMIKEHISSVYQKVQLVDPAVNTVRHVKTYLRHQDVAAQNNGIMRILVSKNTRQFETIVRALGIQERVEEVNLDLKINY
ncbi:MAG: aspartate/glutamate racemase family protein [Nitrososphaerales archaeon]